MGIEPGVGVLERGRYLLPRRFARSGRTWLPDYFLRTRCLHRQKHRDIPDPEWASIVVYDPDNPELVEELLLRSERDDVIVKASGVGVLDEWLESRMATVQSGAMKVFWDVDAPATLERMTADESDPFHQRSAAIRHGVHLRRRETCHRALHRTGCAPLRSNLQCVRPGCAFSCGGRFPLCRRPFFLGNRLPDREKRVEELFLKAASLAPAQRFVLGGSGWADKPMPSNIRYVGHVYTGDHNAFNCSTRTVLNISRDSMARYGFSPATRVFEAAGAAACLISDHWEGIEAFLQPEREILIADNGREVADLLGTVSPERACAIGEAARSRVLADHTYERRGRLVEDILQRTALQAKSNVEIEA